MNDSKKILCIVGASGLVGSNIVKKAIVQLSDGDSIDFYNNL